MALDNLIFLNPKAFWLLILPLLVFFLLKKPNQQNTIIYFPHLNLIKKSFKNKTKVSAKNFFNFLFLYFIWLVLVISFSNPNIIERENRVETEGYDLMLVLDTSESMSAIDFSTSKKLLTRLDATKEIVKDFISKRASDRIGIIIFAQYAFLESPLTIDNASLISMLDNTEIGMAGGSTAIGDALGLAVNKLYKKENNSRAIILLTDGENNAGKISPKLAADLALKYQIPIYTIGVGTNGPAPFLDVFGNIVHSNTRLDIESLKEIADITKGKFYHAKNQKELAEIYKEIDKLTATKVKSEVTFNYRPIFHYFLIISLSLIMFGMLRYVDFKFLIKRENV